MRKIKIEEGTKQNIIALTLSGVILISFFLVVDNMHVLGVWFSKATSITISFIFGFFIAFVLSPICSFIENKILLKLKLKKRTSRVISSLIAMTLAIFALTAFVVISLPQLTESVIKLMNLLPNYLNTAEKISEQLLMQLNIDQTLADLLAGYSDELFSRVINIASQYLPEILNFSIRFGSTILKVIIGLAIALYIMIDKERFARQFTKISYAFFSKDNAEKLIDFSRVSANVFNRFIIGKALDSLIIGLLTYIGLMILRMPFALLLSVIIGVTNMIPVFGPFIGAVPGVFILFIVDPILVVWFVLFVLLIQQIDGNIIGPAILGDSLGLPTLWIMFAIIVGGGFYGVLGMFFGVPVFAVIYFYIKKSTEKRLAKKEISVE